MYGEAGSHKAWHHIVEQNQISKSGFSPYDICNTKNTVRIESGFKDSIHSKISGYYQSKQSFTGNLSVRDWLVGQSFEFQFEFGMKVLSNYGTMTSTALDGYLLHIHRNVFDWQNNQSEDMRMTKEQEKFVDVCVKKVKPTKGRL